MGRLIDADAAMLKASEIISRGKDWPHIVNEITELLFDEPTVDAVPVVRCRECAYATKVESAGYYRCAVWHDTCEWDGFCNYGERKADIQGEKEMYQHLMDRSVIDCLAYSQGTPEMVQHRQNLLTALLKRGVQPSVAIQAIDESLIDL